MEKIVVFSQFFRDTASGGVEMYIRHFYTELIKKSDIQVTVIAARLPNDPTTITYGENFTVFKYNSFPAVKDKYYLPTPKGLLEIWNFISSYKPAQIHTHTRFYFTHVFAAIVAKLKKIKHSHVEHGSSMVKDGGVVIKAFSTLFDIFFAPIIFLLANKTYAVSEAAALFVKKQFHVKNVGVLYNATTYPLNNSPKSKKQTPFTILFVGRLVQAKGVYELLNAFQLFNNQIPESKLVFVGPGVESEKLKATVLEKELSQKVIFTGGIPSSEVIKQIDNSDAFVNPSYTEGLPSTVLESTLRGIPTIATDVGGTREIIPNSELLIPREELTAENLCNLLIELYNNYTKYLKTTEDYKKRADHLFRWEKTVNSYIME
jgi:glycosyltransferase involved in cell wall biosynthesis